MLNFIDVSSHQGKIDVTSMFNSGYIDAVVVKATEGTGYVNPYCDYVVQQAIKLSKPFGVYHFMRGNDPEKEAQYFYDNCKGYVSENCIPILDFEAPDALALGVGGAREFLDKTAKLWGKKPWIYMSLSKTKEYDWSGVVGADYGLWCAHYADKLGKYSYWPFAAAWQYTSRGRISGYSGNLDKNVFYGNSEAWALYANYNVNENEYSALIDNDLELIFDNENIKIYVDEK